ncbi:MAG: acyl-CoA desaturase [Acidobacteria bacterium]|nr:acyl-CoA desaturase [Acidobacteriota bacterium]
MTTLASSPVRRTEPRTTRAGGAERSNASSYTALAQRIKAEGLLERRHGWYALRGAGLALLLGIGIAMLALLGRTWWQLLVAVYFAFVFTQIAYLAHDSAHKQIFASGPRGEVVSRVISNLFVGLSYGWWMNKHTRHHANPNTIGKDLDVLPGAVVFVPDDMASRHGLTRWLTARQGYYFIPILLLAGIDLHLSALKAIAGPEPLQHRGQEGALIAVRLLGFSALVLLLLGPGIGTVFMAVQLAFFGLYMGGTFAPNHTGMRLIGHGQKVDYLRRQVLTSRNISGGWLAATLMGGLNYQIEHHLFPNMPSINLKRTRVIVRGYCADLGVDYEEHTFFGAWRIVLRYLHRVGVRHADPFDCPAALAFRTA